MGLTEVLQILQIIEKILSALNGMGLKMEGTVNVPELLKLIPRS